MTRPTRSKISVLAVLVLALAAAALVLAAPASASPINVIPVTPPYASDLRSIQPDFMEAFTFTATAGQPIWLLVEGDSAGLVLSLYNKMPDGTSALATSAVAAADQAIVLLAPASGQYYASVHNPSLTLSHTYKMYVLTGRQAVPLTIKTSATSVIKPRPFILTGVLGLGSIGDPVVVYVKKPGKSYWSYSSKRLCYSETADGDGNWWYRYTPIGRTCPRGIYYFKAAWSGDVLTLPVVSGTISVRVR